MNLKEWRESAQSEVTLPSGLVVTYNTRFTVLDLAAQGQIPQALVGAIGEARQLSQAEMIGKMPEFVEAANALIKATWISPKVSAVGSEDSITIDEIPTTDKVFFFDKAAEGSGLAAVEPFPEEQGPNGATPPNSGSLSSEAIRDLRNPG